MISRPSSPHVQQLINFCPENIRLFEDLNSNLAFATNSRTWTSQLLWFSIFLIFRVENFSNFFFFNIKRVLFAGEPNLNQTSQTPCGHVTPPLPLLQRGGDCQGSARRHAGQLADTLDNDVFSVLSVQLTDDLVEPVIICLDAHAVQDLFHVLGAGGGIAPVGGKQVGGHVAQRSLARATSSE